MCAARSGEKKLSVSKENVKKRRANDHTQYVAFQGIDLIGFDHHEWRHIMCKTFSGALSIGKQFEYDPNIAVAWDSECQKAWVKVDAQKHRPKLSGSGWWSGGKFRKKIVGTMIYFYEDHGNGSQKERVQKQIPDGKKTEKEITLKNANKDFAYTVSLGSACVAS